MTGCKSVNVRMGIVRRMECVWLILFVLLGSRCLRELAIELRESLILLQLRRRAQVRRCQLQVHRLQLQLQQRHRFWHKARQHLNKLSKHSKHNKPSNLNHPNNANHHKSGTKLQNLVNVQKIQTSTMSTEDALHANKTKSGTKEQKVVNVLVDFSELMEYAISAAHKGSSTEQAVSVCQGFWATGRYAGRILNSPMRVWG